jgi:hypothetical protein
MCVLREKKLLALDMKTWDINIVERERERERTVLTL